MKTTLSPELETELLHRIAREYEWRNELHFERKLKPPAIALSDSRSRLGSWNLAQRRLEISRTLVLERPWTETVEVLKHEMAHQYVHEVLGILDETAHGPMFRQVCESRAIDGRATGAVQSTEEATQTAKILDRVQKLLALATSSERHEAEAAMRKAHELMLKHNIESVAETRAYQIRLLGNVSKRRTSVERDIIALLTESFFVRAIEISSYIPSTGKTGAMFEICGTAENVAMAEHVYHFLLSTAERLWRQQKGILPGAERVPFQSGVIRGFGDKLRSEREVLQGTGLVWVGDAGLLDFYRRRYPRVTTTTRRQRLSEGHTKGREAGSHVVLNRPVTQGQSGQRRYLGSGER